MGVPSVWKYNHQVSRNGVLGRFWVNSCYHLVSTLFLLIKIHHSAVSLAVAEGSTYKRVCAQAALPSSAFFMTSIHKLIPLKLKNSTGRSNWHNRKFMLLFISKKYLIFSEQTNIFSTETNWSWSIFSKKTRESKSKPNISATAQSSEELSRKLCFT